MEFRKNNSHVCGQVESLLPQVVESKDVIRAREILLNSGRSLGEFGSVEEVLSVVHGGDVERVADWVGMRVSLEFWSAGRLVCKSSGLRLKKARRMAFLLGLVLIGISRIRAEGGEFSFIEVR